MDSTTIIDKVRIILQDPDAVRWNADELLGWLNDGQREIVLLKPEANTSSFDTDLTTVGETRFSIPSDGVSLVEVVRNQTGNKRAIRLIDRAFLDAQNPDWHTGNSTAEIKYYMVDPRNPREFLVSPPSDGSAIVEIIYTSNPAEVVADGDIGIDAIYANALVDYISYRAYSKDADHAANGQRAIAAYGTFLQSLGLQTQAEQRRGAT